VRRAAPSLTACVDPTAAPTTAARCSFADEIAAQFGSAADQVSWQRPALPHIDPKANSVGAWPADGGRQRRAL
jgi:hypothetical protein